MTTQRGSSLVLAIFVIVILTLLGGVLMNISSTSSETVSQEVLGTRAYMAANSAMQGELSLLFPLNGVVGVCNATNTYDLKTQSSADIPGLFDCSAITTCNLYYSDTINLVDYYRLESTGECGSGIMESNSKGIVKSSRSIQVEARSM